MRAAVRVLGVGASSTSLCDPFRTTIVQPAIQDAAVPFTLADWIDACIVARYTSVVIKSFRHKGLERFFLKGTKTGIQAAHAARLARQLQRLDVAQRPQDMNVPGWKLHSLKGRQKGHWSVWVRGNWRLTFMFEGEDAVLVDYQDYH